jgi:hypothetical protein
MRKRQQGNGEDEAFSRRIAMDWNGLQAQGGSTLRARARECRNAICQLRNRPNFSRGVSGDQEACTLGMLSAILAQLREWTDAPKTGLAHILEVHSTRIAAMLDPEKKRWPAAHSSLRRRLLHCVQWMFLGNRAERTAAEYAVSHRRAWTLTRDFPQLLSNPAGLDDFWVVRYAEDIADYFFPESGDFQTEIAQPYFDLARRHWPAPFDREELAAAIRWVRRHVKANNRRAYLAFFCPTLRTAEALFDPKLIRPRAAFAARERPKLLKVHLFLPTITGDRREKGQRSALEDAIRRDADAEERFREDWAGAPLRKRSRAEPPTNIEILTNGSALAGDGFAQREMLAFLYLAYERNDGTSSEPIRERLYVLRPFLADRSFPFAMEATSLESEMFVNVALQRSATFRAQYEWLRNGQRTND